MKLEVAVKPDLDTYWIATIITTCGQLLLLRYDGFGEDRKADFWCDIMTADLHPIGWCEQNKKAFKVPEGNNTPWKGRQICWVLDLQTMKYFFSSYNYLAITACQLFWEAKPYSEFHYLAFSIKLYLERLWANHTFIHYHFAAISVS